MPVLTDFKTKPKFKFRGGTNYGNPIYEVWWSPNQNLSPTTQVLGSAPFSCNIETTRGVNIVNFHSLKKSGVIIPHTPFVQQSFNWASDGVYNIRTDQGSGYWVENYTSPFVSSTTSATQWYDDKFLPAEYQSPAELEMLYVDSDLLRDLTQVAAARIYGSGHDSLTFLAEITKVRKMFKDRLLSFVKLAKNNRPRPSFSSPLGDWLEGRYGWRTLIFDLRDLSEVLANLENKRTRYSERAGRTLTSVYEDTGPNLAGVVASFTHPVIRTVTVSYRGSVTADIEPPQFGFNPVTTAWELLPFSFIVDWFLGVGQWLEALSFFTLESSHTSSTGYKILVDEAATYTASTFTEAKYSGQVYRQTLMTNEVTRRIPSSVSTIPQPRVKLDAFKVFDLMAIAYQLIARR